MTSITIHGDEINTNGNLPAVGSDAPDFRLLNQELEEKSLKDFNKKKLISIVPSLDTPVCATSAKKFDEMATEHEDTDILIVSADLPFAIGRFCSNEKTTNATMLSTLRSSFAKDYGVEIISGPLAGVAARAVVVLDQKNTVIYNQLVAEITDEPDYEAAFAALQ